MPPVALSRLRLSDLSRQGRGVRGEAHSRKPVDFLPAVRAVVLYHSNVHGAMDTPAIKAASQAVNLNSPDVPFAFVDKRLSWTSESRLTSSKLQCFRSIKIQYMTGRSAPETKDMSTDVHTWLVQHVEADRARVIFHGAVRTGHPQP
jgi:hypothetical protein